MTARHRALLCLAVGTLSLGIVQQDADHADARVSGALPRVCNQELVTSREWATDVSRLKSELILVMDGRVIDLKRPDPWRFGDHLDPAFSNRFHSLAWLVPALKSGVDVTGLILEREAALPDPTWRSGAQTLRETGWTEGAVRLRMNSITCIYAATKDTRLEPVMDRLVAANLDPYRYRGAPLDRAHNHGTLANLALIEAAGVFKRPQWREPAVRRLAADARHVFDPCGMTAEQSTLYHRLNVRLWQRTLRLVKDEIQSVPGLAELVNQAAQAVLRLTRPDGMLEAIGTGNQTRVSAGDLGLPAPNEAGAPLSTHLWCQKRGWAANRSSWDDTATHYILRFGPPRIFHGHDDRGAVTWFTQGVPVFSDRGVFDRSRGPRWFWAESSAAHSSFDSPGVQWRGHFRANYTGSNEGDTYNVTAKADPLTSLSRTLKVSLSGDDSYSTLQVSDGGRSPSPRSWLQRWQLAEDWSVLEPESPWEPIAVHEAAGLYLYGVCAIGGKHVAPSAIEVETYPAWRTAVSAQSLECADMGSTVSIETLWAVSPIKGILAWDIRTGHNAVNPPAPDPAPDPDPMPAVTLGARE
jgi:hypothetical protein